jgi:DNA-directed RNA polymerase specialized sigma24 family protein
MAETFKNGSTAPEPPGVFALATPKDPRSYDEPTQEEAMIEVRRLLSDLKVAFGDVTTKLDAQERTSVEIKDMLNRLVPKLDDVAGFIKYRAPTLTDKADLTKVVGALEEAIAKRPTRRQMVLDMAWVFGMIAAAVTLGGRIAH